MITHRASESVYCRPTTKCESVVNGLSRLTKLTMTKGQARPIRLENFRIGQSFRMESDGRLEFESNLEALRIPSTDFVTSSVQLLQLSAVMLITWTCALHGLVPVSDLPSRRLLRSSSTLQLLVPPYLLSSDNHRPSLVSCCSIHRLEFIACLPPVFTISLHVSTTAKDISLSPFIPTYRHLPSLHYATVDFVMAI